MNHSIIEFSFSRVHSGTFFIVLRDLWQRQDQANKFILLYAWYDNPTVADWPPKFFYNLDASREFLHWLESRIGGSQQLEALSLHQLFLRRRPFLVPSTISILDSRLSITVSCSCKASATGPVLRPLQENRLVEEE